MAKTGHKYLRGGALKPLQQAIAIGSTFPDFEIVQAHPTLVMEGHLQPRALSPAYRVSVVLRQQRSPEVRVLNPTLRANAPHRYKDGSLCLYWPVEWRWTDTESASKTVLPWAAIWLYFYELWLDTGHWLGPSSHPSGGGSKDLLAS
jgi:hypothetical protein